jgi:hypothetical protein
MLPTAELQSIHTLLKQKKSYFLTLSNTYFLLKTNCYKNILIFFYLLLLTFLKPVL